MTLKAVNMTAERRDFAHFPKNQTWFFWIFTALLQPSQSTELKHNSKLNMTRMWANAQPDGRPAEHRWRPLFNAAKFSWRPLLDAVQ